MALTGYSSATAYQAAWGALSLDPTVCDGNTATGVAAAHSPPNDVSAAIDTGASALIPQIDFTIEYGDNAPSVSLRWSNDHIIWSTVGLPALSPPPHGGVVSQWTQSITGLSITAQYLHLSVSDPSSSSAVRELTVPVPTIGFAEDAPGGDGDATIPSYPRYSEAAPGGDSYSIGGFPIAFAESAPGGDSLGSNGNTIFVFEEEGLRDTDGWAVVERTAIFFEEALIPGRLDSAPPYIRFSEELPPGVDSVGQAGLQAGYSARVPVQQVSTRITVRQQPFSGTPNPPVCTKDELVQHVTYEWDSGFCNFTDGSLPGNDIVYNQYQSPYNHGFRFQVIANPSDYTAPLVSYLPVYLGDYFSGDHDGSGKGCLTSYAGKTIRVQLEHTVEDWMPTILGTGIDGFYYGYYTVTTTQTNYQGFIGLIPAPPLPVIPSGHSGPVPMAWPDFSALGILGENWRIGIPAGNSTGQFVADDFQPNSKNTIGEDLYCAPWDASGAGDIITVFVPPDRGTFKNRGNIPRQLYAYALQDRVDPEHDRYNFDTSTGGLQAWWGTLLATPCADRESNFAWPPTVPVKSQIFGPFLTSIDLQCGNIVKPPPVSGPQLSVDIVNGMIAAAWVSGTNPAGLKVAVHPAPQKYLGNGANGWLASQTIESDGVQECGLIFLANDRAYLCYVRTPPGSSSAGTYSRTSDAMALSGWSDRGAAPSGRVSAGGRGQRRAWRLLAGSDGSVTSISYQVCMDNRGANWTATTNTIYNEARGPLCGGAWLENAYCVLYTRYSDNHVRFSSSANPAVWTGISTDTGFIGRACGLARHPSGLLAGLVQNLTDGNVRAILSDDKGASWRPSDSYLGITPVLPPLIVADGAGALYVVYMSGDAPRFKASVDGGKTWA